jgi:hypothetical protein
MPVARHKYDITRAEFAEIAEAAAEAVVAELKARADTLVPRQADEMRQLAEWLATTVVESIRTTVVAQLEPLQGAIATGSGDGSGTVMHAGLAEVQKSLGDVLTQWQHTEAARRAGLDRLDEVLVDLRSGISENVTRQHVVLLEVLDQRLAELRLNELAEGLPARIGAVISEAIERSHGLHVEAMETLKADLARTLDAGLERHRSAIIELSAVGERLTGLADQVSEAVEQVVASAFERAQGAQMQRLTVLMSDLRSQHEEVLDNSMTRLETALTVGLERQEALLQKMLGEVDATLERGLDRQDAALESGLERQEATLKRQDEALAAGLVRQEAALAQVRAAEERVIDLIDTVPDRVGEVLAESLAESASRATRVENLLGELAWALGEMRAGNDGLRIELARVAAELPDSAAALQDAAGRSEARLVDLIARVAGGTVRNGNGNGTNGSH